MCASYSVKAAFWYISNNSQITEQYEGEPEKLWVVSRKFRVRHQLKTERELYVEK